MWSRTKHFEKQKVEYLARQSHAKVIMHRFLDVSWHKLILNTTIRTIHVIAASALKEKKDENWYETKKAKKKSWEKQRVQKIKRVIHCCSNLRDPSSWASSQNIFCFCDPTLNILWSCHHAKRPILENQYQRYGGQNQDNRDSKPANKNKWTDKWMKSKTTV